MRDVRWLALAALLLGGGCEPVAYQPTAPPPEAQPSAGAERPAPDELSELMAELIAPRICDRVRGSFVGLPPEDAASGAEGGLAPAAGRWWIRHCEAVVEGGQLRVTVGGPGWTWLDRENTGFRVRQYLRFRAGATFAASLHVGYDARARVASIWLRPAPDVRARVEPMGLVQARATGFFSSVLGGLLDLTGSGASDRARQQAASEGSQRLTERLATGFTVTYQLDAEQMDFVMGQLPRGQTPLRPWAASGVAWLSNERARLWPGGLDVFGPTLPESGWLRLDVELEEGEGLQIRRVCEAELHAWLDAAWAGREAGDVGGEMVLELAAANQPREARVPPAACRTLWVVTPLANATTPVRYRHRMTPLVTTPSRAPGDAASTPAVAEGSRDAPDVVRPRASRRLQIVELTIRGRDGSGEAWDIFGGEPDPYVVVASIPTGREIFRTATVSDQRSLSPGAWLPAPVADELFPLRFIVYDEDVGGDQVVGSADLDAAAIPATGGQLSLELRSLGTRPAPTGALTLRVQPLE